MRFKAKSDDIEVVADLLETIVMLIKIIPMWEQKTIGEVAARVSLGQRELSPRSSPLDSLTNIRAALAKRSHGAELGQCVLAGLKHGHAA